MYTGIVQDLAPVIALKRSHLLQYALLFPKNLLQNLEPGMSVAVDGICQTVVRIENDSVWFDATEESCSCTTLKYLKKGDRVHLERSLKFGDEIGGHILSGHVTTTVELIAKNEARYTFACSDQYLFNKGFVALNGVSLTVCECNEKSFTVHLIPETLKRTTFPQKEVGDLVNIEFDPLTQAAVDTVSRLFERRFEVDLETV